MLEKVFDKTVDILEVVSEKTGITYKRLNVIGMFAWMGITVGLVVKAFMNRK